MQNISPQQIITKLYIYTNTQIYLLISKYAEIKFRTENIRTVDDVLSRNSMV